MEHIVQFAISMDDERIKQICEEKTAEQVMNDIKEFSHGKDRWGNRTNATPEHLTDMFKEAIDKYVKEHADEIVKVAIEEVAKNMMKTKKVRESLETLITNNMED